jgi:hypothetical protein
VSTPQPRTGLANDPRILAGAAAGLVSALAALWTFNGLPLGTLLFWLSPLPLFLAGLSFGLPSALIALAVTALALLLGSPGIAPVGVHMGFHALPAILLLAAGLPNRTRGQVSLGLPLAILGLWPAFLVLLAGVVLFGQDASLETALRDAVAQSLARMGVAEAPEGMIEQVVRLKAGALALWLAFVLGSNAAFAQKLLLGKGLSALPRIRWSEARLPRWYPVLPALAGLAWMLADPASDLLPLSLLLALGVPLLLQGLATLHTRLPPAKWRTPVLVAAYVSLLVFVQVGAIILVALGLVEQFGRRNPPPANT